MAHEENDPALQEWKKQEAANETEQLRSQLNSLTNGPKKTCLHRMFSLLSLLMGMSGLLMLIGQIVGLYFYESDPVQGVMRGYVILLCLLVILNELQWTQFIRESAILRIWITRGIFYSFVGVLGLEENDTSDVAVNNSNKPGMDQALKFIEVVAYMMVACGILYFVMGCLCLQLIKNRIVTDYEQRCNEAKENRKKAGKAPKASMNGSVV